MTHRRGENPADAQPGPAAIRWVEAALGATVTSTRVAQGATSSAVFFVQAQTPAGPGVEAVLRLFTNREWLAEEPDLATHEAAALRWAQAAGLRAPELLAFEAGAQVCGAPALLMRRVPGRVDLRPMDFDDWLLQMAEELARIHSVPADGFGWHYASWTSKENLQPPGWSRHPQLWARAIERVLAGAPEEPQVFIHRDYHPVNALWVADRLSAVVDWVNACRGPAGVDLAHCRGNLSAMYGVDAADRFLAFYKQIVGPQFLFDPYWDMDSFLGSLPESAFYEPWAEFGLPRLSPAQIQARDDAFVKSVMAEWGKG